MKLYFSYFSKFFFLISWSTIFFLYYHMGQIDFDIADTSQYAGRFPHIN